MSVLVTVLSGNEVTCSAVFKNDAGTATDPTGVTFTYQYGSDAIATITWDGSSSTPAVGTVWRTGTGAYSARITATTAMAPTLNVAFEGSGALVATVAGVVGVTTSPAIS